MFLTSSTITTVSHPVEQLGGLVLQSITKARSLWWITIPTFGFAAPLAAIVAVYMVFKLGFFVGGSALAAIFTSGFTYIIYRNRMQGAHAANMGQTAASSCGSIAGIIGVLLQAFVWIGGKGDIDLTSLILFTTVASMFGIGIGMLYTPVLVDRMQLKFPTGYAVFLILQSMMTWENFRRAVSWLGSGFTAGFVLKKWTPGFLKSAGFSPAVFGAGMIVGPRIAIPGLMLGLIGFALVPTLVDVGWITEEQEFRHVGFYFGLTLMLGAAIVHIAEMLMKAKQQAKSMKMADSQYSLPTWVKLWTLFWGLALIPTGMILLNVPISYLLVGIVMSLIFVLVNGISTGVSDANPATGAFVIAVMGLAFFTGADDKLAALVGISPVLCTIALGVDMQQDRSTGWRLGSNRTTQFWFQVIGVMMGIGFGFYLAPGYLEAYPELTDPAIKTKEWSSAFTLKVVGALDIIDGYKPHQLYLLGSGLILGMIVQLLRIRLRDKLEKNFVLDALILPSPYAFAFGSFVPFTYTIWYGAGGIATAAIKYFAKGDHEGDEDPEESSTSSLIGGGLMAGAGIVSFIVAVTKMFG